MKTSKTIRNWIKNIEPYTTHKNVGTLAHGMVIALECVLYGDWPVPVTFLKFGTGENKKNRGRYKKD
jgi:hypothetical protein